MPHISDGEPSEVDHLQVGGPGGSRDEYSVRPDAEVPVAGPQGEGRQVDPIDLAWVEDEKIVAAAVHLRETHKDDSTGRPARVGDKKALGTERSSRIFRG